MGNVSKKEMRFFEIAKQVSYKSPSKFKLGCVIVNKKHQVLSIGFNNMTKTHPRCPTFNNFLHAELDALLGLNSTQTKNGYAYVYRETKGGLLANSKPCEVCLMSLTRAGIKKIFYTTGTGMHEILCR